MLAAIEDAALPQQKRQQLLALAAKVLSSARPQTRVFQVISGAGLGEVRDLGALAETSRVAGGLAAAKGR